MPAWCPSGSKSPCQVLTSLLMESREMEGVWFLQPADTCPSPCIGTVNRWPGDLVNETLSKASACQPHPISSRQELKDERKVGAQGTHKQATARGFLLTFKILFKCTSYLAHHFRLIHTTHSVIQKQRLFDMTMSVMYCLILWINSSLLRRGDVAYTLIGTGNYSESLNGQYWW